MGKRILGKAMYLSPVYILPKRICSIERYLQDLISRYHRHSHKTLVIHTECSKCKVLHTIVETPAGTPK